MTVLSVDDLKHKELTERIIGGFLEVYHQLGNGFPIEVYRNALYEELKSRGVKVEKNASLPVHYRKQHVGDVKADLLAEDRVLIILTVSPGIDRDEEIRLVNYLRATGIELGLLLNFGRKPEIRRKIYEHEASPKKESHSKNR